MPSVDILIAAPPIMTGSDIKPTFDRQNEDDYIMTDSSLSSSPFTGDPPIHHHHQANSVHEGVRTNPSASCSPSPSFDQSVVPSKHIGSSSSSEIPPLDLSHSPGSLRINNANANINDNNQIPISSSNWMEVLKQLANSSSPVNSNEDNKLKTVSNDQLHSNETKNYWESQFQAMMTNLLNPKSTTNNVVDVGPLEAPPNLLRPLPDLSLSLPTSFTLNAAASILNLIQGQKSSPPVQTSCTNSVPAASYQTPFNETSNMFGPNVFPNLNPLNLIAPQVNSSTTPNIDPRGLLYQLGQQLINMATHVPCSSSSTQQQQQQQQNYPNSMEMNSLKMNSWPPPDPSHNPYLDKKNAFPSNPFCGISMRGNQKYSAYYQHQRKQGMGNLGINATSTINNCTSHSSLHSNLNKRQRNALTNMGQMCVTHPNPSSMNSPNALMTSNLMNSRFYSRNKLRDGLASNSPDHLKRWKNAKTVPPEASAPNPFASFHRLHKSAFFDASMTNHVLPKNDLTSQSAGSNSMLASMPCINTVQTSPIRSQAKHRETAFICSCGKDFESLYVFTLHMKDTGHKPKCDQPEKDIPKLVRGQDMWINSETEQTREILRCMRCHQSFRTLPELTMHMVKTNHYSEIVYNDSGRCVFVNPDESKRTSMNYHCNNSSSSSSSTPTKPSGGSSGQNGRRNKQLWSYNSHPSIGSHETKDHIKLNKSAMEDLSMSATKTVDIESNVEQFELDTTLDTTSKCSSQQQPSKSAIDEEDAIGLIAIDESKKDSNETELIDVKIEQQQQQSEAFAESFVSETSNQDDIDEENEGQHLKIEKCTRKRTYSEMSTSSPTKNENSHVLEPSNQPIATNKDSGQGGNTPKKTDSLYVESPAFKLSPNYQDKTGENPLSSLQKLVDTTQHHKQLRKSSMESSIQTSSGSLFKTFLNGDSPLVGTESSPNPSVNSPSKCNFQSPCSTPNSNFLSPPSHDTDSNIIPALSALYAYVEKSSNDQMPKTSATNFSPNRLTPQRVMSKSDLEIPSACPKNDSGSNKSPAGLINESLIQALYAAMAMSNPSGESKADNTSSSSTNDTNDCSKPLNKLDNPLSSIFKHVLESTSPFKTKSTDGECTNEPNAMDITTNWLSMLRALVDMTSRMTQEFGSSSSSSSFDAPPCTSGQTSSSSNSFVPHLPSSATTSSSSSSSSSSSCASLSSSTLSNRETLSSNFSSFGNLTSPFIHPNNTSIYPHSNSHHYRHQNAKFSSPYHTSTTTGTSGSHMLNTITKKAKCHFCGKPFANKGQVRLHISKKKCPCLLQQSCHVAAMASAFGQPNSVNKSGSLMKPNFVGAHSNIHQAPHSQSYFPYAQSPSKQRQLYDLLKFDSNDASSNKPPALSLLKERFQNFDMSPSTSLNSNLMSPISKPSSISLITSSPNDYSHSVSSKQSLQVTSAKDSTAMFANNNSNENNNTFLNSPNNQLAAMTLLAQTLLQLTNQNQGQNNSGLHLFDQIINPLIANNTTSNSNSLEKTNPTLASSTSTGHNETAINRTNDKTNNTNSNALLFSNMMNNHHPFRQPNIDLNPNLTSNEHNLNVENLIGQNHWSKQMTASMDWLPSLFGENLINFNNLLQNVNLTNTNNSSTSATMDAFNLTSSTPNVGTPNSLINNGKNCLNANSGTGGNNAVKYASA